MKTFNMRSIWLLVIALALVSLPEAAFAKKQAMVFAVDGGTGGTIRATKKKLIFTCRKATGCSIADIDMTDPFDADTAPDPDFEIGGWTLKDISDNTIETFPNLNKITLKQNKKGVKLIVSFRKKPFPIRVSVENPEGGTITGANGQVCATSTECSFPSVGVDDLANLIATPLDGWEVEKWTVTDMLGMAAEYPDLKLIRIKQTRNGYRVKIKFRKKLLPVLVAVQGGVGGSIVADNGKKCSTAAPCMFPPKKKDDTFTLTTAPAPGYIVSKWTVIDDDNNVVVSPKASQLSVKQNKKGVRILLTFVQATTPCAGDSIPAGFTPIYTVTDLQKLRQFPTQQQNYFLCSDLDLAGINWQPVIFIGTFEGNYHAINNLTSTIGGLFIGLHGSVVRNLSINNASISVKLIQYDKDIVWRDIFRSVPADNIFGFGLSRQYGSYNSVGTLTGYSADTEITNVHASGKVTASCYGNKDCSFGGLIGFAETRYGESPRKISNTSFSGSVTAIRTTDQDQSSDVNPDYHYALFDRDLSVGGLIGRSKALEITKSFSTGSVTADNLFDCQVGIGGLIGLQGTGAFDGAGPSVTKISKSFSNSNVSAKSAKCLFPAGYYTAINGVYTGFRNSAVGGGLLGEANNVTISDSFATGSVNLVSQMLVQPSAGVSMTKGVIDASGFTGRGKAQITKCYATGLATAQSGLGQTSVTSSTTGTDLRQRISGFSDGYFMVSNEKDSIYYLNSSSYTNDGYPVGVPLSAQQMQQQNSFVGWDFNNTWFMSAGGYPELR